MYPAILAHCDWSIHPAKRWVTIAHWQPDQTYFVEPPRRVGDLDAFLAELQQAAQGGTALAGFDLPIGVPRRYAESVGIKSFREALLGFGSSEWSDFYDVAETAQQISFYRPFYPKAPGGTSKRHLVEALKVDSTYDLLRCCDYATPFRNRACELFWTLGANQVGKGAISAWRDLIAPAVRSNEVALWPFDGELDQLIDRPGVVFAETYPAEFYGYLGFTRGFGKRRRDGRLSQAPAILDWCKRRGVGLAPELESQVGDGFGTASVGEDRFDSLVGALGMIGVVNDVQRFATPVDMYVRSVEGWILGLESASAVEIGGRAGL